MSQSSEYNIKEAPLQYLLLDLNKYPYPQFVSNSLLDQSLSLFKQNKIQESKNKFDIYFKAKDEYLAKRHETDYQGITKNKLPLGQKIFNRITDLSELDLVNLSKLSLKKYANDKKVHFSQFLNQPTINPQNASIMIAPSLYHEQLQLINLKIKVYKSLGKQNDIQPIYESVKFDNSSQFNRVVNDQYDQFIQQAKSAQHEVSIQRAIQIFQAAIQIFREKPYKSLIHRDYARFLISVNHSSSQVLTHYDISINNQQIDKRDLAEQRNNFFNSLLKGQFQIINSQGFLQYIDNKIQRSLENNRIQLLIQKAFYFKNRNEINTAIQIYYLAAQNTRQKSPLQASLALKKIAYLLVDIQRYQQGIQMFKRANQLNNNKTDFFRFLLKLKRSQQLLQNNQMQRVINNQILNDQLFIPYDQDLIRPIQKAVRFKKSGNLNQAIQRLRAAFNECQDNLQKSNLSRYLANFCKEDSRYDVQVLQYFDFAIQNASVLQKHIIIQERSRALISFALNQSATHHANILRYFDGKILLTPRNSKMIDTVVQKAMFLKNSGSINAAAVTYNSVVDKITFRSEFQLSLFLRDLAIFYKGIQQYQDAIHCFRKSYEAYPVRRIPFYTFKKQLVDRVDPQVYSQIMGSYSIIVPVYGCDQNRYKEKAGIKKNQGDNNQAISILRLAITQTQDSQQKSILYRKLANVLKQDLQFQKQAISSFDIAIQESEFDKIQISFERKQALKAFSNNRGMNNHESLLEYLGQCIQISEGDKKTDLLVQKAEFLKRIDQINLAIEMFQFAAQNRQNESSLQQSLILKNLSYFYVDCQRYEESIECFKRAISIYNAENKIDFARFLGKLKKKANSPHVDILVRKQMQNITLCPPFDSDENRFQDRAIRQGETGNFIRVIQILQNALAFSQDSEEKSRLYLKLAFALKKTNSNMIQIFQSFDQSIQSSVFDKTAIQLKKKLQLIYYSQYGSNETKQSLIQYFNRRLLNRQTNHQLKVLNQKAQFLENVNTYEQQQRRKNNMNIISFERIESIIEVYNRMITVLPQSQRFRKSKILIKLAYFLQKLQKTDQALQCLDKSIKLFKANIVEKLIFFWKHSKFSQVDQLIQKSKQNGELFVILLHKKALLIQKQALRQIKQYESQDQWNCQTTAKAQQSVEIFNKLVRLLKDYRNMKAVLLDQRLSLQKLKYNNNKIVIYQNRILSEMGLVDQFYSIYQLEYSAANPTKIKGIAKQIKAVQRQLINRLVNSTKTFTIKQVAEIIQQQNLRIGIFHLPFIVENVIKTLWTQGKFKKAFEIFAKIVFVDQSNAFISQYQEHDLLRNCFEILNLFRIGNYRAAFDTLKQLRQRQQANLDSLINMSLYKVNDLAQLMQKIYVLCIWNLGNYQQAAKLLTDLIFADGEDMIYYIDPKLKKQGNRTRNQEHDPIKRLDRYDTYKAIVKYNSFLYSERKGKFKQCLKKAEDLQSYLNGQIKDPAFHIKYANCYYSIGQQLARYDDKGFIQFYCLFMKKYNHIKENYPNQRNLKPLGNYYRQTEEVLKQIFTQNIKQIQLDITSFRNICFQNNENNISQESLKGYIKNVDQKLSICIKIINYDVLTDIDQAVSVQKHWHNVCQVIYKDILKKDIDICYKNIRDVISDVRSSLQKHIMINKTYITVQLVNPLRDYFIQQIQAIIDNRVEKSLNQINSAYESIKEELSTLQKNSPKKRELTVEISNRLIQDNQAHFDEQTFLNDRISKLQNQFGKIKRDDVINALIQRSQIQQQKNEFFMDIISSVKDKLAEYVTYSQIQTQLQIVHKLIKSQLEGRKQKNIDQIDNFCQKVRQQIQGLKNLPTQTIDKDQFLEKLSLQNTNILIENQMLADMMNKVLTNAQDLTKNYSKLEQNLANLQNSVNQKNNVFDINIRLTEISELLQGKIAIQREENLRILIKDTSVREQKFYELSKNLQSTMEINFQRIFNRISQVDSQNSMLASSLKRQIHSVSTNISQTTDQLRRQIYTLHKKLSHMASFMGSVDFSEVIHPDQDLKLEINNIKRRDHLQAIDQKISLIPATNRVEALRTYVKVSSNRPISSKTRKIKVQSHNPQQKNEFSNVKGQYKNLYNISTTLSKDLNNPKQQQKVQFLTPNDEFSRTSRLNSARKFRPSSSRKVQKSQLIEHEKNDARLKPRIEQNKSKRLNNYFDQVQNDNMKKIMDRKFKKKIIGKQADKVENQEENDFMEEHE